MLNPAPICNLFDAIRRGANSVCSDALRICIQRRTQIYPGDGSIFSHKASLKMAKALYIDSLPYRGLTVFNNMCSDHAARKERF
jgi:hypothetical protein